MKRIFFLYFLWVLCLTAPMAGLAEDPWGITQASLDADIFGIDKLLRHETVYYAVSNDVSPAEEKIFVNTLRKWPADTLRAIGRVGREDEFKDITGLLQRGLLLKKTTMDQAEITLEFDPTGDICGQDAAGCHFPLTHRIVVRADYRNRLQEVLTHEIGHFYGLGDQYDKCRYDSSPIYSSSVNLTEGSVMRDGYATKGQLTCDDYDGFINLIDLRLSQKNGGKFSARSHKGWWSLCKKTKNFYQEAKTTNREYGFDSVDLEDERISQGMEYDKKGNLIRTSHSVLLEENLLPLFAVSKGDRLTVDTAGRIIRIVSSKESALCPLTAGQSMRTFTYTATGALSYNIRVMCVGQKTTYSMPVVKSTDWFFAVPAAVSGKAHLFRREFPFTTGYNVAVTLKNHRIAKITAGATDIVNLGPDNDRIHTVRLIRDLSMPGYHAEVEGFQEHGYVLTKNDFQQRLASTRMIPSHKAILLEAKDAYDQVVPYASNFYEYFYKPLLGLSNTQQAQQQVKKRMRPRR